MTASSSTAGGVRGPARRRTIIGKSAQKPLLIRTDLRVPVFMSETQTDLIMLGYAPAQQPNTDRIRTWEIAGTSHADIYEVGGNASVLGCTTAINTGPQHVVVQAAFADFSRWVTAGNAPTTTRTIQVGEHRSAHTWPSTRMAMSSAGCEHRQSTCRFRRSAGRLLPAPRRSVLSSERTTPFSSAELTSLYGSKANYLSKYTADLNKAISGRYLLTSERADLLAQASQVQFPSS